MRLDKFLKVSRLIKRRTVANEVSEQGRVFVNDNPAKPAKQLKEGDIIKLENKTNEDLIVKVNDEKKFFARPGTLKNKICIKITDRYDATIDSLKGYI